MRYVYVTDPHAFIRLAGDFDQEAVSLDQAQEWLRGDWQSAVRDGDLAEALSTLTGIRIPVDQSRRSVVLSPGDEALVFRLWVWPREGKCPSFVDALIIKMKEASR